MIDNWETFRQKIVSTMSLLNGVYCVFSSFRAERTEIGFYAANAARASPVKFVRSPAVFLCTSCSTRTEDEASRGGVAPNTGIGVGS